MRLPSYFMNKHLEVSYYSNQTDTTNHNAHVQTLHFDQTRFHPTIGSLSHLMVTKQPNDYLCSCLKPK